VRGIAMCKDAILSGRFEAVEDVYALYPQGSCYSIIAWDYSMSFPGFI
jgi:hypothetical protein